jgi:ubiquinone/menaquinone biosynthesis C-methylase UbiE
VSEAKRLPPWLTRSWTTLGREDPLWAVLTDPSKRGNRWEWQEFLRTGQEDCAEVLEWAESLVETCPRGRALDFGCGVGRVTQALAEHFSEVEGVDVSPSMIACAEERNRRPDRCRFHVHDRADLALYEEASFDFVYSKLTIQHMPPRLGRIYLREFGRVLGAGGLLAFQAPSHGKQGRLEACRSRLVRQLKRWWIHGLRRRPVIEVFGHPRREVEATLAAAGLELLDVRPDESVGPTWVSYFYCARKPR